MSTNLKRSFRGRSGLIAILGALVLIFAMVIVGDIAGWLELKDIRPGTGSVIAVPEGSVCFPSCASNDGRFISLAGTGLETLVGDRIHLEFAAPADATSLEIGIFDGDTSGLWDLGTAPLEYTLYADPGGDGTGTVQVGQWLGNSMADDNWYLINVPINDEAKATNGFYFYRMVVRNTGPTTTTWSNFKVRTDGYLILKPSLAAFAFTASMQPNAGSTGPILYSGWPSVASSTYDGTWDFYMDVPEDASRIVIWDGDFDYGDYTCTNNDDDDADTPNDVLPPWAAGTQVEFEGVASTTLTCRDAAGNPTSGLMTGNPPDDALNPNLLRAPATTYQVITPDGTVYANNNPSGNREWEQFSIDIDANAPADHHATKALISGLYHIKVSGMDLNNLNAWRFDYDILGVCADGTACKRFPITQLGDYVWVDENENGIQEPTEPGIPNVKVDLKDTNGNVLDTHYTDSTGFYETFQVPAGTYNVTVDTNTLPPDLSQTYDLDGLDTPHTADVTLQDNQANLDVDFGYVPQQQVLVCEVHITHPQDATQTPGSGGFFFAQVDPDTGDVYIRYTQSLSTNDNTYGASTVNWPGGGGSGNHKWHHLVNSDQTRFEIKDANGNVVVDLYMDYISTSSSAPTGYMSLGPTGGDGSMNIGNVNWIYDWKSSMQVNLERYCNGTNCTVNGVNLLQDSPPTLNHQSYELVDPTFSDWIFPYWIEFHVKAEAFGGSTFGSVQLTDIHNSPAKFGNDQFCVGGGCGECIPAPGQPRQFNPPAAPLPPSEPTDDLPPSNPEAIVASLTATTGSGPGTQWKAIVTITVVDGANAPIANALVSGTFTEGGNGTMSCTTNASGQCTITSGNIVKSRPSTTFTVTDVSHSAYTYQSATSTDTLTVNKP